jgi:transposase-like protein
MEGYTLRQIAAQSGHSVSTVRRIIRYWLAHPPPPKGDFSGPQYLVLDGTRFGRRKGIFAVMEAGRNELASGSYGISEGPSGLGRFCAHLAGGGLSPKSATVDGNPHLNRLLHRWWPQIILQRCLVHIQRQGLSWCRRHPKRTDAKCLRELFLRVMSIRTPEQRDAFLAQVYHWEKRYGHRIARSPETGWVFSDLKRARRMLLTALPNMFHYLQDRRIPKSTNALEGYFGRLKQKYRQHHGLAIRNREAYFQWYFHLCQR